jgi:DNA-directed RNA polymerase sigma subunit (sigma70/sigma32)
LLLRTEVEDILDTLTPRERRVLQLRFGLIEVSPDSDDSPGPAASA